MRWLWVVEMWNPQKKQWEATVGVRISRKDGREELKDWRMDNPGDRFQLSRYVIEFGI